MLEEIDVSKFYTLEVYKTDRRARKGERLCFKQDYEVWDLSMFKHTVRHTWAGHRIVIQETYVTRRNLMTGAEFQERYDTPRSCSPASETYWSA